MTLADLVGQLADALAITAKKLREVTDVHNGRLDDIERRLAKLEPRVPDGVRDRSSVTFKPARSKVVTSSGWQGRSEFVNIHARIPDDGEWMRALELLRSHGFDVYRSGRQGE